MNRFTHDIQIALRGLRRTPAFTITVVLILALGIGMAAAMVTVFDAVLLRKLPVVDQDQVVVLWTYRDPAVEFGTLRRDVEQLNRESRTMRGAAAVAHWGATGGPLLDGDRTLVLGRSIVSGNFFDVMGARPVLGRLLRPEDEVKGAAPVLVLSYRSWQQVFGGDTAIVGRRLKEPYSTWFYTIVGVAPPGLDYPSGAGYWLCWPGSDMLGVTAIARLATNVTSAQARSEFLSTVQRLPPDRHLVGAKAFTLTQAVLGDVRPVLVVLTAAVTLLLLIACVNVGNLMLLRAAMRARELAIRRALGASFADVVRQLLVESGLLAALGGGLGLVCAELLLRLLVRVAPERLPRLDVVRLAGTPVAIALGVTLVAVLVFGLVPALIAARVNVASPLRLDSRSGKESRSRRRIRQSLVSSQVSLALIMLAGAGLLARSLTKLEGVQLGYTADHLSIIAFSWPATRYDSIPKKLYPVGEQVIARLHAIPGLTALTPIVIPPFIGANVFNPRLDVEGQSSAEMDANPNIPAEMGGPEYFRTFRIPLLRGRGFLDTDRENAPFVAVVSEAVARRFWPNEDPIGKRIRYWGPDTLTWRTVVGVAGDIHFRSLRDATPTVYLPWRQGYWQAMIALRTTGDLASLLPAIRREMRAVDPELNLWSANTMDALLAAPLAQPRMSATVMSIFGLVALLLASIGLYGVMASAVREQTREIGVRIALGATPERVRGEVLRRALGMTVVGAIAGVAIALAGTRLLATLLFQVSPTDPLTFAIVCVLLVAVGLAAAYLPARRATRVDPVQALRAE